MLTGLHFFTASALSFNLTNNYFSSFLLGLVSHHLLDRLSHLDINIYHKHYNTWRDLDLKFFLLAVPEFFFFLILTFYFLGNYDLTSQKIAFVGGLAGILPDILNFLDIFLNKRLRRLKIINQYVNFHKKFHYRFQDKYFLPLLIEFIIFLFSLLLFNINYWA